MRAMKDSGLGWVGDIPASWDVGRIGGLYKHRNTKVSDADYPPLSVTMSGIVPQLETAAKSDDHDNRKLVMIGDFAINSRSDRRGSCGISSYDGSVSLINTVLEPREVMNPAYYDLLFHTSEFADEFYKWGHGIVDDLWTTRWTEMKSMKVPVPSLDEQQCIANYLDARCYEIDVVLRILENEIETLDRLRKSVIHNVVTRGLDESVSVRDSGVEYIGKMPSTWEVRRLKYCVYLRARLGWKALKADEYQDEGYPMYSAFNIINHKLDTSFANFITEERYLESPEIMLSVGDVLLVKDGAGYGKHAYVEKLDEPATVNSSIGVMTPLNGLWGKYLNYFLDTGVFEEQMELLITGMGVPHLTQHFLCNVYLPFPPLEEQQRIAEYLDERCTTIDSVIETRTKQLERLEDYRKALIFAYVTGKKEVPAA